MGKFSRIHQGHWREPQIARVTNKQESSATSPSLDNVYMFLRYITLHLANWKGESVWREKHQTNEHRSHVRPTSLGQFVCLPASHCINKNTGISSGHVHINNYHQLYLLYELSTL